MQDASTISSDLLAAIRRAAEMTLIKHVPASSWQAGAFATVILGAISDELIEQALAAAKKVPMEGQVLQ
jgi:hypothetical protein